MKLKHIATLCVLAPGLSVALAQEIKLPGQADQPAAASTSAKAAFTDQQLIEEFGWFIGKRVGLTELEFSKAEVDTLLKGIALAASGKDSPYELEKIGPAMDEFMQKKQQAYLGKLKTQNLSANTDFFNKLKENKAIVELPSGLRYVIVKQGDGPAP